MEQERRKFCRLNFICKVTAVFGERVLVFNSHTEDLGEGGVRVVLEEKLHVSTQVEVSLFLTDKEVPVNCMGEVTWVREILPVNLGPRFFHTGIKFLDITGSDQEIIKRTLEAQK